MKGRDARSADEDRFRITVYVEEEDLTSLDELKAYYRRTERRNLDRSSLVREAVRAHRDRLLGEAR